MSYLKLHASETLLTHEGLPYIVRPGEPVRVAVRVDAGDVPEGALSVEWENASANLMIGFASVELPAGTYSQEFEWLFDPRITEGAIHFEVKVRAGTLFQQVMIPVTVEAGA